MNKQQELFERFRDLEYRLRYLSAFIQNDFDLCGDPSFDDWLEWIRSVDKFEKDISNLFDETDDFIFDRIGEQQ